MSEKGTVIEIKNGGGTAVVAFNRTEACAKCRACMAGFIESQMILEAKNDVYAEKGDIVLIELPKNGFFTASAIMYVFPLIAMIAGFLLGGLLGKTTGAKSDILSFGLGIALLAVSLIIVRLNENKFKSISIFHPHVVGIAYKADKQTEI